MIVKTVFEVDGTTKVFMVPFVANFVIKPLESFAERFQKVAKEAWMAVHGQIDHRRPITDH